MIYIPSQDPYSLGFGGKLLADEEKSIVILLTFTSGESLSLSIRKGRITNILVEPDNLDAAKANSSLESPFSIFSPGLAGVSRTETFVSDGVLLRALARGDANVLLRNILYRLSNHIHWDAFENDLGAIFPNIKINMKFEAKIDEYIDVFLSSGTQRIPLDLAGTGFLQATQLLAYFHLFSPKMIVLDEPDSHLHPNNQRLLCALLSNLSIERNVQVILTTHSRHILEALYSGSTVQWVENGKARLASPDDQVEILLSIGALDIKEKIASGKFELVVLTEDSNVVLMQKLLD